MKVSNDMKTIEEQREFSELLERSIEKIDISDTQFAEAVERYEAVGAWLAAEDSPLAKYQPDLKPQGSFRLGTVIKPLDKDDEFDVDLTCKLLISKKSISQQQLKALVGDRLRQKYKMDKEKRRCWRLNYSEKTKFHMDIVPAIPDENQVLLEKHVSHQLAEHALCITDNKTWDYSTDWPRSNPEGYALWFVNRMMLVFEARRRFLAESLKADVANIPEYRIKTPLQRTVQLLKRHRDSRLGVNELKPVSIILTTLAAHAYNNEDNLHDTLFSILKNMDSPDFIRRINGNYYIANPVNPDENFADKWNENPGKRIMFFDWLEMARKDFNKIVNLRGYEISENLEPIIGKRYITEALKDIGVSRKEAREAGKLKMAFGTGILSSAGKTPVRNHGFFGEDK